jgi:hypothetical protein
MTKHKDVFTKTTNGVTYQSQDELDKRVRADAEALAHLAYDMYKIQKQLDTRLEREPGGFMFPVEGRMCRLCIG